MSRIQFPGRIHLLFENKVLSPGLELRLLQACLNWESAENLNFQMPPDVPGQRQTSPCSAKRPRQRQTYPCSAKRISAAPNVPLERQTSYPKRNFRKFRERIYNQLRIYNQFTANLQPTYNQLTNLPSTPPTLGGRAITEGPGGGAPRAGGRNSMNSGTSINTFIVRSSDKSS